MNSDSRFNQLIQEVDFLLAEKRHLRERGIHLIVTHLGHVTGTLCAAGEWVGNIALGGLPEPLSFGFAQMSLFLVDCFCRYRMPLTASRIEEIMTTDPFYARYGENGHNSIAALPDRTNVRIYVPRIHKRMEQVFRKAAIDLDPRNVLVAELTESRILAYRLKATVEFLHVDRVLQHNR